MKHPATPARAIFTGGPAILIDRARQDSEGAVHSCDLCEFTMRTDSLSYRLYMIDGETQPCSRP